METNMFFSKFVIIFLAIRGFWLLDSRSVISDRLAVSSGAKAVVGDAAPPAAPVQ